MPVLSRLPITNRIRGLTLAIDCITFAGNGECDICEPRLQRPVCAVCICGELLNRKQSGTIVSNLGQGASSVKRKAFAGKIGVCFAFAGPSVIRFLEPFGLLFGAPDVPLGESVPGRGRHAYF